MRENPRRWSRSWDANRSGPRSPCRSTRSSAAREVLRLLVAGKTDPEIAAAPAVSRATVRTHVSNFLAKLGVRSRTEAADAAHRRNLLR